MCAQLAKPERAGGGVRGGAPSARPRRPARPLAHAPPPAVRHGDAPEEVDPGLALAFGRPGGLRWDFPFYATKSRFVGQVLPCRPSRAASRSARRGKTGLTHPKNLPLCTPGGTMTPASHPPGSPGRAGPCPTNRVFMAEIQLFDRTPCRSVVGGGPRCPAGAAPPAPAGRPASITLPAGRTNHRFRALDPPASRTHIPFECLKRWGGGGGFKAPKRGCRHAPTASSGTNNLSYKPQAARRRLTEKKGRARRPAPSAPSPKAPRGAYAGRAPPQIPDLCAGRRNATTRRPREASPRRSR